jgi:hypothetical protein
MHVLGGQAVNWERLQPGALTLTLGDRVKAQRRNTPALDIRFIAERAFRPSSSLFFPVNPLFPLFRRGSGSPLWVENPLISDG